MKKKSALIYNIVEGRECWEKNKYIHKIQELSKNSQYRDIKSNNFEIICGHASWNIREKQQNIWGWKEGFCLQTLMFWILVTDNSFGCCFLSWSQTVGEQLMIVSHQFIFCWMTATIGWSLGCSYSLCYSWF